MPYTKLIPFKFVNPLNRGDQKNWTLKVVIDRFNMGICGECMEKQRGVNRIWKKFGMNTNYTFESMINLTNPQLLFMSLQNINHDFEDKSKLNNKRSYYCYNCSVENIKEFKTNPTINWNKLNESHISFSVVCSQQGHPNTCCKNKNWLVPEMEQALKTVCAN